MAGLSKHAAAHGSAACDEGDAAQAVELPQWRIQGVVGCEGLKIQVIGVWDFRFGIQSRV